MDSNWPVVPITRMPTCLHGPAGIGKRALAERLMASLLCQRPVNLEACGACKSCLLLKAGSHPDNYLLEPEEADKAIKVDQVRDLVSFVVQTAQMGRAQGGAD